MMKSEIITTKRLPSLEIKVDDIPGITAPLIEGRKVDIETGSGGVPVLKTYTIPKATATGNYNITFPGLGTPKFVKIQASMELGALVGMSDCSADVNASGGKRWSNNDSNGKTMMYDISYIIYTETTDSSSTYRFKATFVEFITDGIKINIGENDGLEDIKLILTFYK